MRLLLIVALTMSAWAADPTTGPACEERSSIGLVLEVGISCAGGGGSGESAEQTVGTDPNPLHPARRELRCARGIASCDNPPMAPASGGTGSITIADLASFSPAVGELVVQPENWGVLGIPTNFVATATDHVQSGTLLGQPIQVRWRPTAFTFDYGDGTVVTTGDPGAMWVGADDDWTATSTSHEYQSRGEYAATVTITFEADVGTGGGWSTVAGTLELAAPAETVQIFEVHTVLTRGDCIDYPDDPGCSP